MLTSAVPESRVKRDRAPYLDLLDDYRKAAGRTWNDVDAASGVVPSTREQWFNGVTKNVPLVGFIRVAVELDVPPQELFDAIMGDEFEPRIGRLDDVIRRLERLERIVSSRLSDQEIRELEAELDQLDEGLDPPESEAG